MLIFSRYTLDCGGGGKLAKDEYGMNVKQKSFADEYIISGNIYQAALKAGWGCLF